VTLRGRVLAIGGLKEKLLAALRSGVKTVLIPQENEKDLADIPDNVKGALEIIPVSNVDEALKLALTGELTPIEWTDPAEDVALGETAAAVADPVTRRTTATSSTEIPPQDESGGRGGDPGPLCF
jgi:ATP-dependent Lon protease